MRCGNCDKSTRHLPQVQMTALSGEIYRSRLDGVKQGFNTKEETGSGGGGIHHTRQQKISSISFQYFFNHGANL